MTISYAKCHCAENGQEYFCSHTQHTPQTGYKYPFVVCVCMWGGGGPVQRTRYSDQATACTIRGSNSGSGKTFFSFSNHPVSGANPPRLMAWTGTTVCVRARVKLITHDRLIRKFFGGTNLQLPWGNWEKLRNISVRIVSRRAQIRSRNLPNMES
jgi:hypothetical protein